MPSDHRYAVVVAGGAGTRLWPLSRERLPKQMRALMSDKTLINETVDRIRGVVPVGNIYVSTTANYEEMVRDLVPDLPAENLIVEPVARGTAAAFALLSHTLASRDPDAIVFSLASDHAITEIDRFAHTLVDCFEFIEAHPEHIALVGITPTRPDTGLGYVKIRRQRLQDEPLVHAAEKFVEKPSQEVAQGYVDSGDYFWNAGYYCFAAATLLAAYDDADPGLGEAARAFAASGAVDDYLKAPEKVHEIEVIDSGKYPLAVVPGHFTWSDIGNWRALHQALSDLGGQSLVASDPQHHIDVESRNCLVFAAPAEEGQGQDRIVATIGLDNIVVVDTEDVTLVLDKDHAEQLPKMLELLRQREMRKYL